MAIRLLLKRNTCFSLPGFCSFCSKASPPTNQMRLLSLLQPSKGNSKDIHIELVNHDSWKVSAALTEAWKQMNGPKEQKSSVVEPLDYGTEDISLSSSVEDETLFDDIEDMRFRGKLFYKLDRDSREFDECNLEFHGKKSLKKRNDESKEKIKKEKSCSKEKEVMKLAKVMKNKAPVEEVDRLCDGKERTLTFNQLTAPYHQPFCLDIFISKSSVRACIIHRVTCKVVVVAHSISKDMKFDLKSTKDNNACAAVGEILAQRALEDDIHDIVYTPRKGDKLEGKLHIVLQSVIDHGINVKVKIKQRKAKKGILSSLQHVKSIAQFAV